MPNTREKLIKFIHYCTSCEECRDADIADHLIANGVTVQKWIPVTEMLPEKAKKVLALTKATYRASIDAGEYITWLIWYNPQKGAFYRYDSEYGDVKVHDVTHWMPLPEPPKGE